MCQFEAHHWECCGVYFHLKDHMPCERAGENRLVPGQEGQPTGNVITFLRTHHPPSLRFEFIWVQRVFDAVVDRGNNTMRNRICPRSEVDTINVEYHQDQCSGCVEHNTQAANAPAANNPAANNPAGHADPRNLYPPQLSCLFTGRYRDAL